MLMKAWRTIEAVTVPASRRRNGSTERNAIRIPAQPRARYSETTTAAPNQPSSSPMIAKMKSLVASGR
jgi:hypothetical protein